MFINKLKFYYTTTNMKQLNIFSPVYIPSSVTMLRGKKFTELFAKFDEEINKDPKSNDSEIHNHVIKLFYNSYKKILMVKYSHLPDIEKYQRIIELLNDIYIIPMTIKHNYPHLCNNEFQTGFTSHNGTIIKNLVPKDWKKKVSFSNKLTDKTTLFTTLLWNARIRGLMNSYISWGTSSNECFKRIKDFTQNDTIIEVGSGWGFWALMLQLIGCNIIATDDYSWIDGSSYIKERKFTNVRNISAYNIFSNDDPDIQNAKVLMLVWPPYNNTMAAKVISNFKGDRVIYVGEKKDGCTGDDIFHKKINEEWNKVSDIEKPTWATLHDRLYFYKRHTVS